MSGLVFCVHGLGFWVQGLVFEVQGLRFRVPGTGQIRTNPGRVFGSFPVLRGLYEFQLSHEFFGLPVVNNMIRTDFPYSDDIILYQKHGLFAESRVLGGGGSPPKLQTR